MRRNRWLALFQRSRLDRELRDEMEAHLAMQAEEFQRRGMSPEAARAAALREFGGVTQAAEDYRERSGVAWIETAARDVRYALRGLQRNPGFTAPAVLSLALGIGANTAIFSVFHALMLRTLPVANPHELVYLFQTGAGDAGYASPDLYLEFARRTDLFSGVLSHRGVGKVTVPCAGGNPSARADRVSPNYFQVLGVSPALGRSFDPGGESGVAIVSYQFWRGACGGDPEIIGRVIDTLQGPLRVIGVAPPGFAGVEVESRSDVWIATPSRPSNARYLWLIARLRAGVGARSAQSALDTFMTQFQRNAVSKLKQSEMKRRIAEERIEIRDGAIGISFLRQEFGTPLRVLFALVGAVLLAACVNLAQLLLARGAGRAREIAIRRALGATRSRLIVQTMMESFLLTSFGCALGIALAGVGARGLLVFLPKTKLGTLAPSSGAVVAVFAVAASMACAMAFGLIPAIRSTAVGSSGLRERTRLHRAMVSVQVAFSVVLVAVAGLFAHSLMELRSVNPGLSQDLITFWLEIPGRWKASEEEAVRARMLTNLAALPGVVSVSFSAPDALQGGSWNVPVRVPGSPRTELEQVHAAVAAVGPRYAETIGAALIEGRDISTSDTASSPPVALVNQAFVHEFLHDTRNAVGRVFTIQMDDAPKKVTIAGVIRDVVFRGPRRKAAAAVYLPSTQCDPPMQPGYAVRSLAPAAAMLPAIRAELTRIASGLSLIDPKTVRQRIDDSIFQDRILAVLSGFFGGLALLLAAVGLHGVVAYTTARRSREIGIRVALGATERSVAWLVLRDALAMVIGGLAIGLPLAIGAARVIRSLLFGVTPDDPAAFVTTAAVLLAIGLVAALIPARRAAKLDPATVLRTE
jgi:predicted permease